MAIKIGNLKRLRASVSPRILIYGTAGIGKTSLASEFPAPVFLQTEEGTPGDVELMSWGVLKTFQEVLDAIAEL